MADSANCSGVAPRISSGVSYKTKNKTNNNPELSILGGGCGEYIEYCIY